MNKMRPDIRPRFKCVRSVFDNHVSLTFDAPGYRAEDIMERLQNDSTFCLDSLAVKSVTVTERKTVRYTRTVNRDFLDVDGQERD